MIRLSLLAIILFAAFAPIHANAQDSCGQSIDTDSAGEAIDSCNEIYDRQFEYRKSRIEFRKAIDERRKQYAEPMIESRKRYDKKLADLNNERNHDNDLVAK
ncbi:MAG: hypothetical protein AB8B83_03940 [Bdellovibrionales bacterium]